MKKLLSVLVFVQLAMISAAQNVQQSQGPAQDAVENKPWDIYVILGASFVVAAFVIMLVLLTSEWQKDMKLSKRRKSASEKWN